MQKKGLDDYVDVAERIRQFYEKHPEGRINTVITEDDGTRVVIHAAVYRTLAEIEPSGTGHAEEIRGQGMVNKTSHIENCETSAVGRALAMIGLATTGGIASRQEMEKVQRMTATQAKDAAKPKTLTVEQATRVQEKLDGIDPLKVEVMLAKYGVDGLGELTVKAANEIVKALVPA